MRIRFIVALLLLAALTACGGKIEIGFEPAQTDTPALNATLPPTSTIQASALPPTFPAATLPAPTATTAPTEGKSGPQMVEIYLIAMEDNGISGFPVGCGDSAVAVDVQIAPTQGVLKAALQALLAIKDQYYGQSGLYDALYQSDLQVDSVTITNGKATVNLSGSLLQGGECDSPRVQAQLERTVLQFPSVTSVEIYLNGRPLSEVLSLK